MSDATIVVGAGSAGVVVASRLSEDPQAPVILLEAGPDPTAHGPLPADLADGRLNSMTAHDWGWRHRPRPRGPRFPFPRGRVVGGSSAVNTCIALRGVPADYDEWAALGLEGWSFDACLPYFRRLERDLDFHGPHHGADGPLPIRRHPPAELTPWSAAFAEAALALGWPGADDANHPEATGLSPHPMNKRLGRRVSAAEAWLTPEVRARPGLEIRPGGLVDRLVWRGDRVVGVERLGPTGRETVLGRRVVLAAGAIATPGILLRSGIGPRAELGRLGLTCRVPSEGVTARLLDHPGTAIFLRPRAGVRTPGGPLIQIAARLPDPSGRRNGLQLQPGSTIPLPRGELPLVSLMAHVGKPRGVGRLRFPSVDPTAPPVIESRLFEDAADLAAGRRAIGHMLELAEQPAIARWATPLLPSRRALGRSDAVDAWIRRACDSSYHPCGTAPMGPDGDPDAVADRAGRVRGVEGLWIADASLMPTVPTANTHLTVLMMAERIADALRGRGELAS